MAATPARLATSTIVGIDWSCSFGAAIIGHAG
jgi:hypothetical protein